MCNTATPPLVVELQGTVFESLFPVLTRRNSGQFLYSCCVSPSAKHCCKGSLCSSDVWRVPNEGCSRKTARL